MTAVIYSRVAAPDPDFDAHAHQAAECRAWAFAHDVELGEHYADTGMGRGEFHRLVQDARDGKVQTVVLTGLDRLPRLAGSHRALQQLLDVGVRVVCANGSLDTQKPLDAYFADMLMVLPIEPVKVPARSRRTAQPAGAPTLF